MLPPLILAPTLLVLGCERDEEVIVPDARPVRVVTVEERKGGEIVTLTGHVHAQEEAALAFRIGGRMIQRHVNVGDRVETGQVIARLEPQDEVNAQRSAEASLVAAQGQLTQARNDYERQKRLLEQGHTTRARYDQARQVLQTAESQVDDAEARLKIARDRVSFTELKADAPGIITHVGAEPGEVVQSGRMIVQLARKDGRDAVFDVPARVIQSAPADPEITVVLTSNPAVRATGHVREVAPQADPITRTFQVKVGLSDPPATMRLGSTVTGSMQLGWTPGIEVPATALTSADRKPAVWIVDPAALTVSLRNIEVERYDLAGVTVRQGLQPGDVVITAGVQALRPGQKVRILGEGP